MKTKKKAAPPNKNNHNIENCRSSWPNLPQRLIKHLRETFISNANNQLWEPNKVMEISYKQATLLQQKLCHDGGDWDFLSSFHVLLAERGKPDSHDWIKQDCLLVDPHDEYFQSKKSDRNQPFMRFTNAIGVNGKFYALSSQGTLVVIEHVVDIFEITGVGKARAIPSVLCKGFRECLIECDGEILLVFLVLGEQDGVVDGVEVYKLCLDDLSLIKMKSLGEKTLFVGSDCCVLVDADKVGCRGNCVYFREQREGDMDGWFEYDMKVGEISLVWSHSTTKCVEWDEPIAEDDDPDLKRNREIIGYPHKYKYLW
ncbi:hypothetical protein CsatB_028248 [Cannabis sativa]